MKDNSEIRKELTGKKIDVTWSKYKLYRNKKYLIRLNKLIDRLVIIDIKLDEQRKREFKNNILLAWPSGTKSDKQKISVEKIEGNKKDSQK